MTWHGRKPPCYEYIPKRDVYAFHVSEKESVEVSSRIRYPREIANFPRAPLVRLLTGVSCLEMLSDPLRWARYYGLKPDPSGRW
jgi:hypothetical protein